MKWLLSQGHAILALYLLAIIGGVYSYLTMPLNLFPDVNKPMVSVIVQWPGAASDDVAREVTHPVEVRLTAIDGVSRVTSTSRDEVSAVKVEFDYGISIEDAANKVATELPRVTGSLPAGTRDPLVFKITEAARPRSFSRFRRPRGMIWIWARSGELPETRCVTPSCGSMRFPRPKCSAANCGR